MTDVAWKCAVCQDPARNVLIVGTGAGVDDDHFTCGYEPRCNKHRAPVAGDRLNGPE